MSSDRKQRAGAWAAFASAAVVALAGCSSSAPPERFHTLLPGSPAVPVAVADPVYIDVLPVSVPAQVDHPQWVLREPDGSLRLLEQDRWAAPLPDEFRSAIVARLGAAWGAVDVRRVARPVPAVWRIRVDVQRFDSVPGAEARIDATWSLSSGSAGGSAQVCHGIFSEPVHDAGVPALAAAHRRAVVRLADSIGRQLKALRSGGAGGC